MPGPRADLPPWDRYGARLVAARLDVLRLLRALDHVGVDPDDARTPLRKALIRLAEYDGLLTSTLAVLDAQGRGTPEPPSITFEQLLVIGPLHLDDVLKALTPADADAVRRALPHVHATEAEVLAEVDEVRRSAAPPPTRVPTRSGALPTRNGPCPCGSGQKYKKCCLEKDEAREAARPAPPPPAPRRASAPALHELDHRLVLRIVEFARARYPRAIPAAIAAIDRHGNREHVEVFLPPWLAYHTIVEGAPLVERFLRHEAPRLRPDERAWLEANAATPVSIWSVEHVTPGASMRLRDALTGEVRDVTERMASESLRRGDGVCARVVDHAGLSLLIGMHGRGLPPVETERVAAALRAALPGAGRRGPETPVPPEALAGENARTVLVAWCDAVRAFDNRPPPVLTNTDGERLEWTVDRFAFAPKTRDAVLRAIGSIAGVDPAERGDDDPPGRTSFRRAVAGSKALGPEGWTSHGRIDVDADAVSVECNSTKRADRLRAELEAACGDRLTFVARERKSLEAMMAKTRDEPRRPPPPTSPEIDALIRATKERAYDHWVDEKIPALGGVTPRQANTDPALRRRLEALVMSIEQTEARQPAGQRFDVGRIRQALGWPTPGP
jgi:hypothetical protein